MRCIAIYGYLLGICFGLGFGRRNAWMEGQGGLLLVAFSLHVSLGSDRSVFCTVCILVCTLCF